MTRRNRARAERAWVRHWQRRALRLQHELAVARAERNELQRRLEVLS